MPSHLLASYFQYLGLVRIVAVSAVLPVLRLPISICVSVLVRVVALWMTTIRMALIPPPEEKLTRAIYSVEPAGGVKDVRCTTAVPDVTVIVASSVVVPTRRRDNVVVPPVL